MRIAIRDRICEILATLYDGINCAVTAAPQEAAVILGDCRDAVAAIGNTMAAQLSYTRAAFYLERLDGVLTALEDTAKNAEAILTALSEIYTELLREDEVKIKVAFFPYKASMWDSLESVWTAASRDPRCEAAVVPIRYADKAPGGAILKITCERDMFPDYVPTVNFEEYDPEAEAPDIAYIHNPYDGNNYVTSVDPAYYSQELKKHVGTLVYVPYYVSGTKTTEPMARSACASAADVIVMQSETDAEVFRGIDASKDYPVLGSPKVDRILRYEREKPDMPEEWRERLFGKTVFLLNTSVSTLLKNGEKFCDKLGDMFDLFEGRDNIALLWRPHPLSDATINSMRPELAAGYRELERRVREGGFGVLDETADVTRAIALSDAYIGESASSLRFMYAITGKPVYMFDFKVTSPTKAEREDMLRSAFVGKLTFEPGKKTALSVNQDVNDICRIELQTGKVTHAADIPGVPHFAPAPHGHLVDVGDKYILPPAWTDRFLELDRELRVIREIEVPERARADAILGNSIKLNDFVYFIPSWGRAFARYCLSTGDIEYFYDWYESFKGYEDDNDKGKFSGFFCTASGSLYIPCYKDNVIAELNFGTMKVKKHRVGSRKYRYHSIDYDGRYFWLTRYRPAGIDDKDWHDSIVRWDAGTGKTTEFHKFPQNFEPGYMSFRCIKSCGSYLLAFPSLANMILKIDPENGKMTEFGAGLVQTPDSAAEFLIDPHNAVFGHINRLEDDGLYGIMLRERALLTINTETGETKKLPLRYDSEHKAGERSYYKRFQPDKNDKNRKGVFVESHRLTPADFISIVASGDMPTSDPEQAEFYLAKISGTEGDCGEKIHEYIIGRVLGLEDE